VWKGLHRYVYRRHSWSSGYSAAVVISSSGQLGVVRDENGEIYTVRYDAVNPMLLNEFLKEHRKNEEQNSKIESQARKIQEQETTIAQLESGMKALAATVNEQASELRKVSVQLQINNAAAQ
jgi:hypothetical protein